LYSLGFDGMGIGYGMVWYGDSMVMYVFFGDNSFSHYNIGTHDVEKSRFSRVRGLYRIGTYSTREHVVRGCHPAGEHHYKNL